MANSGGAIGLADDDTNFSSPSFDFGLLSTEGGDRGCPIRVMVSIVIGGVVARSASASG